MSPDPPLNTASASNVSIDIDNLHDRLLRQSHHPNSDSPRIPSQSTSPSVTDHVTSTLRQRTVRLRTLKVRAEFEYTLLLVLAIHVVYMYYLDHTLLVFLIRVSQLIRLLHFSFENQANQRGTAVLLLLSNLPVLVIHKMIFTRSQRKHFGQMLFINFIGPEPKSLAKTLYIDVVTIILQTVLLQCRWDVLYFRILSALPVPASEPLVPVLQDPQIDTTQHHESPATDFT